MLRKTATFLWALMLGLAILSEPSAAQPPSGFSPVSGASAIDSEFQSGVELYRNGYLEEALNRLRGFVIRNPQSPLVEQAYLYLARIFHDRDSCSDAMLYLDRLDTLEDSAEARALRGSCLVVQGRIEEGRRILSPLQEVSLEGSDRALVFGRLAEVYTEIEQPLRALLLFQQAIHHDTGENSWLPRVHQLLGTVSDPVLEEAAFMFRGSAIGRVALLQKAQRAEVEHRKELALSLAGQLLDDPAPFAYREEARALLSRLSSEIQADKSALGAILPLSGRYATFGELVQRGMQLALALHNQGSGQARIIFRDSGAEPTLSADALATLANVDRVMAVAGPLTGSAALAAAQEAQALGVPLLSLSPRAGLPETGPFVFRNSLTAHQQTRALARYAVATAGLETFGVLYPESRLGGEMFALFSEEVARLGGEVVAVESYAEGATDFRVQIKLLMGEDPNAPEEEKELAEEKGAKEEESPEPPFDALFIPDYADTVGLIAPQLTYYGLEGVQLLGINGWNSPELLELAGRFVEGAVFVDGFFADSPNPVVQEFVALYRDTYGEQPSILEAQAFDSAGILLYLLSRPDVRTRMELRNALASLKNYPGVTGNLSAGGQGEIERDLFLITVDDGQLVELEVNQGLSRSFFEER